MADPILALHKALLASLQSACSCSVYDGVPLNVADSDYPYVVIDYAFSNNMDFLSLTERMDERYVFLSIFSRVHGQAEVMEIIGQIQAIHEQPLTLASGTAVSVRVDSDRTYREPDALTFRGQVVLRIFTTHF